MHSSGASGHFALEGAPKLRCVLNGRRRPGPTMQPLPMAVPHHPPWASCASRASPAREEMQSDLRSALRQQDLCKCQLRLCCFPSATCKGGRAAAQAGCACAAARPPASHRSGTDPYAAGHGVGAGSGLQQRRTEVSC